MVRATLRTPRRGCSGRVLRPRGLSLEFLEPRTLPTNNALAPGPILEMEPNDTIDQAQSLGNLNTPGRAEIDGTIGRGSSGRSDVDWYEFSLDHASAISVVTRAGSLASMLSLYGSSSREASGMRAESAFRLLAQDDGADHGGSAHLERALAAGNYTVAVSGSGNRYFHPLIAGSGYQGQVGAYELVVEAIDLGLRSSDGPVVLATDPASGANLNRSPFIIRIDLSTGLDARSIRLGHNAQLSYTGANGISPKREPVALASAYFDQAAGELDLTPAAPLRPGDYSLLLAGDRSAGQESLVDPAGNPLGKSQLHPAGADFTLSFRVDGVKGNQTPGAGADDTPATAHDLGELADAGLVEVPGAIGDDPTNPIPFSGSDVDLYHFHLRGTGRYAFTSEVFAGRIGSPLDPSLSLFRLDSGTHRLQFVASNDNSFNPALTHDGRSKPLFTDPILNVGLTEGDYYLAVSASGNVPMPAFGRLPGTSGVFDPNVSHSGKNGSTVGDYVLNLAAEPMNDPPHVTSVATMEGSPLSQAGILTAPPIGLSMTFDKAVNLRELFRQTGLPILDAVYIQDSQGNKFFPHLVNYTDNENRADFLMHDALANGVYELHLSSAHGLTDMAGNALIGNDPSGDYVRRFTISGPARGSDGNPRVWLDEEPNDDSAHPQNLGVLFPAELETGVFLDRKPIADASDLAKYYEFRILQTALYSFGLTSPLTNSGIELTLTDQFGKAIPLIQSSFRGWVHTVVNLGPGAYILGISGWSTALSAKLGYQLSILSFAQEQEPVPPLSVGPAPAIRIRPLTADAFKPSASPGSTSASANTASAPNESHNLENVTSSFVALAAGSIGGPISAAESSRPSGAYESIPARGREVLLGPVIAQLPLLIPSQHSGTEQDSPDTGPVSQWLQTVLHQFEKLNWSHALELFYSSPQWQERFWIRPANVRLEEMPQSAPDDADGEPGSTAEEDRRNEETLYEAMLPVWAMAATLIALTAKRPDRRQGSLLCSL
jgi:hypothetical protein